MVDNFLFTRSSDGNSSLDLIRNHILKEDLVVLAENDPLKYIARDFHSSCYTPCRLAARSQRYNKCKMHSQVTNPKKQHN